MLLLLTLELQLPRHKHLALTAATLAAIAALCYCRWLPLLPALAVAAIAGHGLDHGQEHHGCSVCV